MAPGDHARRVGQRLLEEERPADGTPPTPAEEEPAGPTGGLPSEPAVPAEGSAAQLQRRRRQWLEERERHDGAAARGTGTVPPSESDGSPAPNG